MPRRRARVGWTSRGRECYRQARFRGKSAVDGAAGAGMMRGMGITLCLLRHGRAFGQGPDAALLPEGEQYVAGLGRRLAAAGFAPARAYSSPYRRARETARLVLAEVAPGMSAQPLTELQPDHDPGHTLAVLRALELPAARVLLVAHLPLLGLLVQQLTREIVAFSPGTLVEVEIDDAWDEGRVTRVVGTEGAGA